MDNLNPFVQYMDTYFISQVQCFFFQVCNPPTKNKRNISPNWNNKPGIYIVLFTFSILILHRLYFGPVLNNPGQTGSNARHSSAFFHYVTSVTTTTVPSQSSPLFTWGKTGF